MSGPVIVLADHDDPDIRSLTNRLETAGASVKWLRLGLSAGEYELHATAEDAVLTHHTLTLSLADIQTASVVVHRRWRLSPPEPPVHMKLADDPGDFGQREWEAAMDYVFWLWHVRSPNTAWGNPPAAEQNRLALYCYARESGLRVPDTTIATLHTPRDGAIVAKAIATNENIYKDQYYPTTLLPADLFRRATQERSPCPNLFQAAISPAREIRVAYSFGSIGAVALDRDHEDGPTDIRFAADVTRTPCQLPSQIASAIRRLAARAALEMFTLDILVDKLDRYWVVDVTPTGLITSLDDSTTSLVTCWVEGIIKEAYALSVSLSAESPR